MRFSNIDKAIKLFTASLSRERFKNSNQINLNRLLLHLKRSSWLVGVIVQFYFIGLSVLSLIRYGCRLHRLHPRQIDVIRHLTRHDFLITPKINNLLSVLIILNADGDERLKKGKTQTEAIKGNKIEIPFLVIGSGPGGAITAQKLSERFQRKVILVEAGDNWDLPRSKHPADELLRKWQNGGICTTLPPQMINVASGFCLGGGSEINSGLFHEPDTSFFMNWERKYSAVPFARRDRVVGMELIRSLINFDKSQNNHQLDKFTKIGAQRLGVDTTEVPKFITDGPKNTKNSMTKTFISSFSKNGGKTYVNCKIEFIERKNNIWLAHGKQDKEPIVFECKYLFLCCGAIYTNQLLLKSGISEKKHKTIRSFSIHPMVKAIAEFPSIVQNMNEDVSSLQVMDYFPDFIIGNAASSRQFLMTPFTENPVLRSYIYKNWQYMKMFHSTFSLGHGRILNTGKIGDPLLDYKFTQAEKDKIRIGFTTLLSFIKETGAKAIIPALNKKQIRLCSNDLDHFVSSKLNTASLQISAVHLFGGVTAGENASCVADSFGKIKSEENLFVNDASLINNTLLKNPQGTVMLLALRNINVFLERTQMDQI